MRDSAGILPGPVCLPQRAVSGPFARSRNGAASGAAAMRKQDPQISFFARSVRSENDHLRRGLFTSACARADIHCSSMKSQRGYFSIMIPPSSRQNLDRMEHAILRHAPDCRSAHTEHFCGLFLRNEQTPVLSTSKGGRGFRLAVNEALSCASLRRGERRVRGEHGLKNCAAGGIHAVSILLRIASRPCPGFSSASECHKRSWRNASHEIHSLVGEPVSRFQFLRSSISHRRSSVGRIDPRREYRRHHRRELGT